VSESTGSRAPSEAPRPDDRRIDDVLRRAFTPPATDALAQLLPVPTRARRWPRVVGVALAAAAVLLLAWFAVTPAREDRGPDPAVLPAMWVAAYHDAVTRGFDSTGCCDGDGDIRARCQRLFAAALDLRGSTDVELCGAYCGLPAGGAAALLARAGDEPVCVFVLPRARAVEVPTGDVDGLRIHRREVGVFVVFEVSRLPDPRVLPHLYVPEG
jgi:hypothetical protein